MLKLAGENIVQEKLEVLTYSPNIVDSADLEAATHTIVPTTRPAIGSAQYTKSLTLPKPDDARLEVLRIASRLAVTIDSLGTATHVYCSVRVDVDDTDHELFNGDWTSTGAKLSAVDTHSANKAVIFNLLKDGAAHTFYFLFWADAASQAVISLVELWEGVGTCAVGIDLAKSIWKLTHSGMISFLGYSARTGTGTLGQIFSANINDGYQGYDLGAAIVSLQNTLIVNGYLTLWGTVATDINYNRNIRIVLRSEQ